MANQNKLKAYVRYDGTGRVIAGGPILQRFKPAVGNWVEINANECCNSIPTTTTTTTQGGGVTPTAWITVIATTGFTTAWDACNGIGSTVVVYTSVSTITAGTYLYSDAALTTLIPYNVGSIAINGLVYDIVNGQINPLGGNGQVCTGITTTTTTTVAPTTTTTTTASGPVLKWAIGSASAACLSSQTLPFSFNNGSFCASSEWTLDTTGIGGNSTFFYGFYEGNAFLAVVTSPTTASTFDNCIPTSC